MLVVIKECRQCENNMPVYVALGAMVLAGGVLNAPNQKTLKDKSSGITMIIISFRAPE